MGNSVKLTIQLTDDQMADYPVSAEALWFDKEGDLYRLQNIPMFIDNLSFNDLVDVRPISDVLFEIIEVVSKSENSTVWLYFSDMNDAARNFIKGLEKFGCVIEGGVLPGYYAVNVPGDVNFATVHLLILAAEDDDLLSPHYPSIRHLAPQ